MAFHDVRDQSIELCRAELMTNTKWPHSQG